MIAENNKDDHENRNIQNDDLETNEIIKEIKTSGISIKENIVIKIFNEEDPFKNYICLQKKLDESKNTNYYIGLLNDKLMRSFFGQYIYENGDLYIGGWIDNNREGLGVYLHKNGDLYCGQWEEGKKSGPGIQIWKSNETDEYFIGNFSNHCYQFGLYCSNIINFQSDDYNIHQNYSSINYIYFGEFTDSGEKNDKNCFLYDFKREFIFHGEILNNKADNGYQIKYDKSKNKLGEMLHFQVSATEDRVCQITKFEAIDADTKQSVYQKCDNFIKNFVINNDYFEKIISLNKELDSTLKEFQTDNIENYWTRLSSIINNNSNMHNFIEDYYMHKI